MNIKCPHCESEYEIDESICGRFVRCEVCGAKFVAGTSVAKKFAEAAKAAKDVVGIEAVDNRRAQEDWRRTANGNTERVIGNADEDPPDCQFPAPSIVRVSEGKYFLAWLAYSAASWVASQLLGLVVGAIIGFFMGLNGASLQAIATTCAIAGTIVSIPVGYFSFRYIAITIINKSR